MANGRRFGDGGFDLQGHRGARGLWPENTLAGFTRALAIGVTTLELDCAVTRDGVVVVSHDPVLNPDITRDAHRRFLETPGPPICTLNYHELQQYDVGRLRPGSAYAAWLPMQQAVDGERIPRLADLFALVERLGNREVRFNIETKVFPLQPELTLPPAPFTQALLAEVRRAGMDSRTTIQSFDWRTLQITHQLAPQVATVALTDQQPGDDTIHQGHAAPSPWLGGLNANDFGGSVPGLVKASGAGIWSPDHLDLSARIVAEAHELALTVVPWTINEPAEMARVLALGVDGMISDRPDLLRAVLAAEGIALPRPTPLPA
jgi:glycerophosphoryl diester phosphodiesterase